MHVHVCTIMLIQNTHESTFSSPDPKGHVRYCHHFAPIMVCKPLTLTLVGEGHSSIMMWV